MKIPVLEPPFFVGIKHASAPASEANAPMEPIDLNYLNQHPHDTFLVQHRDLSMVNAFIPPDALLLVDKSVTPQNNSIVLANVNGELMVRYFKKNDYKRKLVPASPKYPEIDIIAGMDFSILGVIIQVIFDPGKLKDIC